MTNQDRKFKGILKGKSADVVKLAESLRRLVLAADSELQEEVKDGYSVYGKKGITFAITVHQNHVNLQFYYGTTLTDPEGLLVGLGKRLRHIAIRKMDDLRADYLTPLVREAANQESPVPLHRIANT